MINGLRIESDHDVPENVLFSLSGQAISLVVTDNKPVVLPWSLIARYLSAEHRQAVAAALALDPSPSSDLTVRINAAGAAHLLAGDDGGGCGITVPKERRREIGLALVDDQLREDMADVVHKLVAIVRDGHELDGQKAAPFRDMLAWAFSGQDAEPVMRMIALFGATP